MAAVEKIDIPVEAEFMPAFCELVKKLWIPEDNEQYREDLVNETIEMREKYQTEFCHDMIDTYTRYLDEETKTETEFMPDFCELVKKFWIPEDSEQYRADFIKETSEMEKKYRTEFCRDMIATYTRYLKKKAKPESAEEFMLDFWKLVKKFWIPEDLDNEQYWEDLVKETSEMAKKYQTEFYHDMIVKYVGYLDKKAKKEKERKDTVRKLLGISEGGEE